MKDLKDGELTNKFMILYDLTIFNHKNYPLVI